MTGRAGGESNIVPGARMPSGKQQLRSQVVVALGVHLATLGERPGRS